MRSLIWVLVGLMGTQASESDVAAYAGIATMALGLISAAMPERGVKAVAAVQEAAGTARDAAELAVSAAQEAKATTGKVVGIVEGPRR